MKNKFLLISLLSLIGCDPFAKLTGQQLIVDKPSDHIPIKEVHEGNFYKSNYVEIDMSDVKDITVFILREGKWFSIEGYEKPQKTPDTYYVVFKNTVIFMNIATSDLYSIQVTR